MVATKDELLRTTVIIPPSEEGQKALSIDMALDPDLPVVATVERLAAKLPAMIAGTNRETDYFEDPRTRYYLKSFGGVTLQGDKSLREQGIGSGERLRLSKEDANERYQPLYDDVAEAITVYNERDFTEWDNEHAVALVGKTVPVLATLISVLVSFLVARTLPPLGYRVGWVTALGLTGIVLAIVAVTAQLSGRARADQLGPPVLAAAYALIVGAAFTSVPRPAGLVQVVVSSVTVTVVALVLYMILRRDMRLHFAVISGGLIVTIVSALNYFAYRSEPGVIAVQLTIVALFVILIASRQAMTLARISLPYVPATGESFVKNLALDILESPRAAGSTSAIESMLNQEEQTKNTYYATYGLIAGALTVITGSMFIAGITLRDQHWVITAFSLIVGMALVFRGKSLRDMHLQGLFLSVAVAAPMAFAIGLVFSDRWENNSLRFAVVVGTVVFGVLIAALYAVQQRKVQSPIVARLFEVFEALLYASPLIILVQVMQLYQMARSS